MNAFNRSITLKALLLLFSFCLSHWALAQQGKGPREVIEESTDRVLSTVERQKVGAEGEVTQAMADELLRVLEPVVDFDSIARGVMGKHRQAASAEQVERFVTVFKDSLSQLYMKSFQSLEVKEVEVLALPDDFDPATATKASVRMRATTGGGDSFSLSYSMRKNEEGRWVVRNIIVDGINLGLTYMNQFDGAMDRHKSIDKTIESWPEEMEDETFDSQENESRLT